MINWRPLQSEEDLQALVQASFQQPCLILKHSTRCNISSIAKFRLEDDWNFPPEQIIPSYLDLLNPRALSGKIAEQFQVHHESPQILLIKDGECVFDASHLDISVAEVTEQLQLA